MAKLTDRLKKSWNAFIGRDPTEVYSKTYDDYMVSTYKPDRYRMTPTNGRTIIASIYNRIAVDVSEITFTHGRVDENERFSEKLNSKLENTLTISTNLDQTPKAFIQDLVLSLFDEGCVAVVPTDTNVNPRNGAFDVLELRTGKIVQWYPDKVKVELYNEQTGKKEQVLCSKSYTAIIDNPFYAVMNDHNSTKERLTHKMVLLDKLDNSLASNKLDLIIQVPYLTKSPAQKRRAETRIEELTNQLKDSPMGIAYSDGTEKIVQLNRTLTNNLPEEIDKLQQDLFNQLGLTKGIFDGTASPDQIVYYYNTAIEPVCNAICDEFTRKFLTQTAISQGQRILYYRDPFKLTTLTEIAEASNNLVPNQIVTANEIRTAIGLRPSDQPQADQLMNPNINPLDSEAVYTENGTNPQDPSNHADNASGDNNAQISNAENGEYDINSDEPSTENNRDDTYNQDTELDTADELIEKYGSLMNVPMKELDKYL